MNLFAAFVILDLIALYQFVVWYENALKNVGWFDGITIPIVSLGVSGFVLANLLVLKEGLKKWKLRTKE